jgi:hypothetical protein
VWKRSGRRREGSGDSRKNSGASRTKSRALRKASRTGAEEALPRTGGLVSRACVGMNALAT